MSLFRRQALTSQQTRLYGRVLIVTPIKFWMVTSFLCMIIAALFTFLAISSFPRIETVRGAVVPTQGIVRVRSPAGGTLTGFALDERETVTKGQILGRVTASAEASDQSTRSGAEFDSVTRRISQIEERIEQTKSLSVLKIAILDQKRQELRTRISQSETKLDLHRQLFTEVTGASDRVNQLLDQGLARAEDLSQVNIQLIRTQQEIQGIIADIELLKIQQENIGMDQRQIAAEAQLEALQLEATKEGLLGERLIMRSAQAFNLLAPTSGTATAILVSNGNNLNPHQHIFAILPENSALQVDLYVPSRAIGFVEKGQSVRLLFDAFPYQRFGAQFGSVTQVTSSVIMPDNSELLIENGEPVYRVTVELPSNSVKLDGQDYALQPGMLLSANIVLEDRTILAWLFEPLLAVAWRT